MSLYTNVYSDTLKDMQARYRQLHNLYILRSMREKIRCYETNPSKADSYYECFFEIEGALLRQSNEFVGNCERIDDEYKICLADCRDNHGEQKKRVECSDACSGKFRNSVSFLYDNFYKTYAGKEPEYKNAKKA